VSSWHQPPFSLLSLSLSLDQSARLLDSSFFLELITVVMLEIQLVAFFLVYPYRSLSPSPWVVYKIRDGPQAARKVPSSPWPCCLGSVGGSGVGKGYMHRARLQIMSGWVINLREDPSPCKTSLGLKTAPNNDSSGVVKAAVSAPQRLRGSVPSTPHDVPYFTTPGVLSSALFHLLMLGVPLHG